MDTLMPTARGVALVPALALLALAGAAHGEGSEIPDGSVEIAALPFTDTGDTSNNDDNFNAECPYQTTGGLDVFYAITPVTDIMITIDLCASDFDTKTYVLNDAFTVIGCNDDACRDELGEPTLRSYLECVSLSAGETYHIAVDGFDDVENGLYDLTVSVCDPPPPFSCPEGAIPEGETCEDGSEDDFNGGCNFTPNRFSPIVCGDVICGEGWTEGGGGLRDTDWYEIVTDVETKFTLRGEFNFENGMLGFIAMESGFEGSGDCSRVVAALPFTFGGPGDIVSITTEFMPPGTHWFFIAPDNSLEVTCAENNDYWFELICEEQRPPCLGDITGDRLVDFQDVLQVLRDWGPCPE